MEVQDKGVGSAQQLELYENLLDSLAIGIIESGLQLMRQF